MNEIAISTPDIDLAAEKIVSDGKIECEDGHMIGKGKIAFRDDADVILCRRHMIAQVAAILDDM